MNEEVEQIAVPDWADQDLLTKDEARGRLDDEIAETCTRLTEMRRSHADEAALRLATRRLDALTSLRRDYSDDPSVT